MDIRVSHYSATGRRTNNEDSLTLLESRSGFLAVVADGLGGLARGEVASCLATQSIKQQLQNKLPDEDTLIDAIRNASGEIFRAQTPGEQMCTTVSVLWFRENTAYAANVGDSRIYQLRDGKIIFQSLDHSVAQAAVMVGELKPSQLRTCPDRNRLTRVLGSAELPKVSCTMLNVCAGDRFLLCSDGFWEPVLESDMLQTLAETEDVTQWLRKMRSIVENANDPAQDNHTAIALAVF